MTVSVHYMRKLAADELWDTLFFATGEFPTRDRVPKKMAILEVPRFRVEVESHRRIRVNDDKFTSLVEAKRYIVQVATR